ncbi:MAG TPA: basic secretory protein-like protein [Longimicrobiales bacterium]|nr:basic secretory protein-like protein [Longimicrobiales bacterium]
MSLLPGRGGVLACLLLSLAFCAAAEPASAQYFGRQKVQYEKFDWQVLETERFDIHYYSAEEALTQDAARMSERWYTRLSRAFQHEFTKKPIIFYADHPDFQQTNATFGMLSEGTGGFTDALRNRVVMPFTGTYHENDHVLGHELVHVFQYDLASSAGGGGLQGLNMLPLWLIEGMAEYLSLGRQDAHTAMWMRDAALRGELPTIKQLTTDARFFPYRYGQALWAYVAGRYGDRAVTEVYRYATRSGFEMALERVLGVNSEQLSQDWITSIRATYLPLIEGRQRPQDAGDRVLYDPEPGAMHLAPAVSPNGQYVAFFGRREIFTVDLYVADARTGEIVKKLTSPNQNQHFDALSFIQSSGTWSPDGSKFAFVVFGDGDHQVSIMDIASRDVERRISIRGVGAVQTLSWSPDGATIAFSGMAGGVSDLYLMNVADGSVRQLTSDKYAQLHPAWSPDGRSLAFVTDQAGTDLDRLTYGEMRLGIIDATTGSQRILDLFGSGKHMNPQFTPDGRDLYFLADPHGFTDLYRVELASGQVFQVTRLATGISGITSLSPAMSLASQTGRIMYSVFENSGNNIYGIDLADARGEAVERTVPRVARAAILPPVEALGTGLVAEYLADPVTGLPETRQFATREYNSNIGLEYIAPPTVGIGTSSSAVGGVGASGGIGLLFGDMLGDQQIQAVVQANGSFKDIGGQAYYLNMKNRWNWGAIVGHIPMMSGYTFISPQEGRVYQDLRRVYVDQALGTAKYPFSTTRRFEVTGGYTRYGFDNERVTYFYDGSGRQPIIEELPSEDPLHFMETSIAMVGDNSFFGLTSPVAGQRWRAEISPTFGSLTFQTALADYRRYLFKRPFTLAVRGLPYGRYGSGADGVRTLGDGTSQRIMSDLFLGYEPLIRGYAQESFSDQEYANNPMTWNRLLGTRVAVFNMELRIPLLGVPELGLINFPMLPIEISPFFDAGVAWSSDEDPSFDFQTDSPERIPVFSAGLSARANILGYVILETYYAYPFQRPDKGWHLGFNLSPGW